MKTCVILDKFDELSASLIENQYGVISNGVRNLTNVEEISRRFAPRDDIVQNDKLGIDSCIEPHLSN